MRLPKDTSKNRESAEPLNEMAPRKTPNEQQLAKIVRLQNKINEQRHVVQGFEDMLWTADISQIQSQSFVIPELMMAHFCSNAYVGPDEMRGQVGLRAGHFPTGMYVTIGTMIQVGVEERLRELQDQMERIKITGLSDMSEDYIQ